MTTIQYYFRPKEPVEPEEGPIPVVDPNPPFDFTEKDEELLKPYREKYGPLPGTEGVGTLYHTENGICTYRPTEYAVFLAVEHSITENPVIYKNPEILKDISPEIVQLMRISSVGVLLECLDGYLAQRRSPELPSWPGVIDSSAAGICNLKPDGQGELYLNPVEAAYSKILRELKLDGGKSLLPRDKIRDLRLSDVHHSYSTHSGMYGYTARLDTESGELYTDPDDVGELILIRREDLSDFIVEKVEKNDIVGDGTAVLLGGLPYDKFLDVVKYINDSNFDTSIVFGRLENSIFREERI